jgi:hypothetical protein
MGHTVHMEEMRNPYKSLAKNSKEKYLFEKLSTARSTI